MRDNLQKTSDSGVKVLSDAGRATEEVYQSIADGKRKGTAVDLLVLSMACRCISRTQGITILLKKGFSDEASIMLRSLAADAQRLAHAAGKPTLVTQLMMSLWNRRMSNIENFAKAAQKSGQPGDQNDLLQYVKRERSKLEKIKRKSGIRKLKRFPEEGSDMAAALDRPDDLIDYVLTSPTMHGTLLGTGVSFAKDKSGVIPIGLKTDNPEVILAVAGRALDYLFLAACSAVKLVESSRLSELTKIVEHARTRFTELKERMDQLKQSGTTRG